MYESGIDQICSRLHQLGIAQYAQQIIRDVLMEVASGGYRDISDTRDSLREIFVTLRTAAKAALEINGFGATRAFCDHIVRLHPDEGPLVDVFDDLTKALNNAANERQSIRSRANERRESQTLRPIGNADRRMEFLVVRRTVDTESPSAHSSRHRTNGFGESP